MTKIIAGQQRAHTMVARDNCYSRDRNDKENARRRKRNRETTKGERGKQPLLLLSCSYLLRRYLYKVVDEPKDETSKEGRGRLSSDKIKRKRSV